MCIKTITADLLKEPLKRIVGINLRLNSHLDGKNITDEYGKIITTEEFLNKILISNQFSPQIRRGILPHKEIVLIVFYYKVSKINEKTCSEVFAILEVELSPPDISSQKTFARLER